MKKMTVAAKVPANKEKGTPEMSAQITVDAPETAAEAIKVFGDEAVLTNANANWIVTLQSAIRGGLRRNETQEQMQARLGGAKMGVTNKAAVVDPQQAFMAMFASATPEKQKEMLKQLTERAAKIAK